jgi:hypothetical protein
VLVRQVAPELAARGIDQQLRREAREVRVDAVPGDPAAGLRDGVGEARLQLAPLARKRGLPVAGDEIREARRELARRLEDQAGEAGIRSELRRAAIDVLPNVGGREQRLVALAAVVPEWAQEAEGRVVSSSAASSRSSSSKLPNGLEGEGIRNSGTKGVVGEAERGDLAPEPRWECACPPDPRVLQRVVLRRGQDVEAEDGLEQRRVRESDGLDRVGAEAEPDDRILFLAKKLIPASPTGTVASNEALGHPDPGAGARSSLRLRARG